MLLYKDRVSLRGVKQREIYLSDKALDFITIKWYTKEKSASRCFRRNIMNDNERRLYKALLALNDEEECRRFLADICTVKEVEDLSSRLLVAQLLSGGAAYNDIARSTGASTATISRVSKCLAHPEGGYRMVLPRLADQSLTLSGISTVAIPNTGEGVEFYKLLCTKNPDLPSLKESSDSSRRVIKIDPQDASELLRSGVVDVAILGEWDAIEQGLEYTALDSGALRVGFGLSVFKRADVPVVATAYPSLLEKYAKDKGLTVKPVFTRVDRTVAATLFDGYFGEKDFTEAKQLGELDFGYCIAYASKK